MIVAATAGDSARASAAYGNGAATGNWVARVQRFVDQPEPAAEPAAEPAEFCELCAAPLAPNHAHLAQPADHRLLCVCPGCAMLLGARADRKFVAVPDNVRRVDNFRLTNAEWDALGIPIGLAFFYRSTADGRLLAFYPGAAGPTESLLDFTKAAAVFAANPVFGELEPDVEALLVNRVDGAHDYYIVPIDRCYALVGLIRGQWSGISGGKGASRAIVSFFAELRGSRATGHHHG